MSITKHPLWPEIIEHVKVEIYARDGGHKNPRFRLEFDKEVTEDQKKRWTEILVPCVRCGRPIHPIRERNPGGRAPFIGHIYLAPCCPLSYNVGCSRGDAAHLEYLTIRKEVEQASSMATVRLPQQKLLL